MYGLILVEPKEGMPAVDRELYVMQGEIYTASSRGTAGLQVIDAAKMLAGNPEYIVFNGRVGSISKDKIVIGQDETVRMYVGNGGVNLISSFHLIGEIFDTVYPEASMGGAIFKNVQTTIVPAGGATIVEFKTDVPGTYVLVDHALARMDKGAWGTIAVEGEERPEIFFGDSSGNNPGH
jgi:nitrite reductase (NO-forming)